MCAHWDFSPESEDSHCICGETLKSRDLTFDEGLKGGNVPEIGVLVYQFN